MMDHAPPPLLAGALSGFALADVLQLLELGARTGILVVNGGPRGGGSVSLRAGRVVAVAADVCGVGETRDDASIVAALLELSAGQWAFHADDPSSPPARHTADGEDGLRISAILVDAARRRDERARAPEDPTIGGPDVPRLSADPESPDREALGCLTAADLHVLTAIDGVRDVRAIATAIRRDDARVGESLARLRAFGVISPYRGGACAGSAR